MKLPTNYSQRYQLHGPRPRGSFQCRVYFAFSFICLGADGASSKKEFDRALQLFRFDRFPGYDIAYQTSIKELTGILIEASVVSAPPVGVRFRPCINSFPA